MIAITFIAEPGELAIKSLLLAYTFRQQSNAKDFDLICFVPEESIHRLSTLAILKKLNVEVVPFRNELFESKSPLIPGDKVSNKLYFLTVQNKYERIVFFDSDMICIKPFEIDCFLFKTPFSAKQADRANVTKWEEIYNLFGLTQPTTRHTCTVDKELLPPYFNAGHINVSCEISHNLFSTWIKYFKELSQPVNLDKNLYNSFNRDQVALSLAIRQLDIEVTFMDEIYNYPIRSKPPTKDVTFAHYHDAITVRKDKTMYHLYRSMIDALEICPKLIRKESLEWSLIMNNFIFRLLLSHKIGKRLFRKAIRRNPQ